MTDQPAPSQHAERVVASRMKLRDRFLKRMNATPSVADEKPMGSGPLNAHGMPKIPPDQTPTADGKWPVLDLGHHPRISAANWRLRVDGACLNAIDLDWTALQSLDQVDDISDFHCVTGWSRLDIPWRGVRFSTLAELCEPDDAAQFIMCYAYDGYTVNLPLAEALKDDVLLVHTADGGPLPIEHGGPLRMITPQLWAWKGAKWINRIEFLTADRLGFWEQRGYSNTAHPWRNDRYAR